VKTAVMISILTSLKHQDFGAAVAALTVLSTSAASRGCKMPRNRNPGAGPGRLPTHGNPKVANTKGIPVT
jgi:hypothetical protein